MTEKRVKQQLQLIERIEAVNRQAERGTAEIAYMSEPLTRMHFPMDRPDSSMLIFERRDGNKNMRIIAHPEYGLPYGSDDLRVCAGIMTEAREKNSKVIEFRTGADMLRYFGFSTNGRGYNEAIASLRRLGGFQIEIIETKEEGKDQKKRKKTIFQYGKLFEEIVLWKDAVEEQMNLSSCSTRIVLTEQFARFVHTSRARGFEFERLKHLRSSAGESQLFVFLRDRAAALDPDQPAFIPIHGPNSIESQLGWVKIPKPEKVRWFLRKWIKALRAGVWPECPGEVVQAYNDIWRLKIWHVPGPGKQ
jgi:hypothetical protein